MATSFSRTTRALAQASGRGARLLWLVAFAIAAAWAAWLVLGSVTVYEVSRKARLEVQQAAHAVAALQSGRVASTALAIGREVQAGDVLLQLDDSAVRLRLQEDTARLTGIPARQQALRDEIAALDASRGADLRAAQAAQQAAQARIGEAAAQADFSAEHARRLGREQAGGNVPEIEALRASAEARRQAAGRDALAADQRRLVQDTTARASQASARIDALRGALAALDTEARTLAAAQARTQVEIERHRVLAPVAGVIGEVQPLAPGSHLAEGQKIATLVPRGTLRVVAEFEPGTALGRLRPGQTARVRLDGFPWAQYGSLPAQVARVGSEIREQTLRVELALTADGQAQGLPMQHGLGGQVEVALETVSPAVLLLRTMGHQLAGPAQRSAAAVAVATP